MFSFLYHTFLYDPLLNLLVFLYHTVAFKSLGLSIILVTLLIRAIFYPLFQKSIIQQAALSKIQPKVKEIQERHKKDMRKQSEELMALYKEHNISPFSGFLFLIIQLPILYALYHIFLSIFKPEAFKYLYFFVSAPIDVSPYFLGLINLKERSIVVVLLAAIAQYFQGKLALSGSAKNDKPTEAEKMSRMMVFLGPIITLVIFINIPAAVSLYWLVTSVVSIAQQLLVNRKFSHGNREYGTIRNGNAPGDGV